jgi:uncharacterized protein (TIGR02231 family)
MRTRLHLLIALATALAANAAPPDETTPVTSKITEVTVYADRARVTRTAANVPLGKRVAFAKLPGWLDEGSVRVSLAPAGNGELVDVQVLKTFLARPDDEELRKAELAVQDIADQMASLDDERRSLEAQERQVDSIRAFSMEKLPKDTAAREVKVEEYAGMVKFVGNSLLEVAKTKRELEKKRRELQPELSVRQRKLNELRQRSQLEQRTVVVTTTGNGAATVTLTYMLPGATWEPVHELRTGNGADKVALASFGVLTQTTGEDWEGVTLSLSTQRSTDTIKIPELEKLLVGGGRPLPQMALSCRDTFSLANKSYSGQIMLWNSVNNPAAMQTEFESNYRAQTGNQALNTARFTALQEQRGTTAHFTGTGPQTVRTDGRSVRVPIGAAQLAARTKIVAAPEMSLNAARTAELNNAGKQPLLPGKVLLFVEGTFLGTTETDFVAPGESFPMFLGVADQIKLSRSLDKKRSSLYWSGKRTRMQVSYVVAVENLGDKEVALQLGDRVPVSETDEVRVQNVKLSPSVKPDNKGLVKWDAKVGPKQTQEFRLEYLLDYPTGFQPTASAKSGTSSPAMELHDQIQHLERALK